MNNMQERLPPYIRKGATVLLDGKRDVIKDLYWDREKNPNDPNASMALRLKVEFESGASVGSSAGRISSLKGELPEGLELGKEVEYRGEKAQIAHYYFRRFRHDKEDKLMICMFFRDEEDKNSGFGLEVQYEAKDFYFPVSYEKIRDLNEEKIKRALKNGPKRKLKRRNRKPGR
jgi:hypothetical protein